VSGEISPTPGLEGNIR